MGCLILTNGTCNEFISMTISIFSSMLTNSNVIRWQSAYQYYPGHVKRKHGKLSHLNNLLFEKLVVIS